MSLADSQSPAPASRRSRFGQRYLPISEAIGEPAGGVLDGPATNRIPAAGQHQGSTSSIRTATNALVAN